MKILFGSHSYNYLHGPGGVIVQILETKAALERLGHQVTLLDPWAPFAAASYDIFHLFCAGGDTYELSLRMKQAGLKLVVHPIIDKAIPEWIIKASNIVIKRVPKVYTHLSAASELCRLADLTVARSAEERHKITFALGVNPSRVAMVPNGVDIKYYHADPSLFVEKHGIRDFILWVGLMGDPNKNLLRLIQVAGGLPLEMVLVGPVQNNDYARRCLKEAGKYKNIRVLGVLEEEELISAYAAADTLILPSIIEGTGLVALEAGLAGAKVVITRNGGPPDYFTDLAEYVDPRSDESIRQKLLTAVSRPKDDRLREHIRANFLWEHVALKLSKIYKQVVT
jgi:glycosyltransferase involved in cell wall biosynthesis